MESVAALGLAANVLQIVELSRKLLSTTHEVYQAGTTVEMSELDVVTKDFALLNTRLKSWTRPTPATQGPLAQDDQSLEALVQESDMIAQELTAILANLKSSGKITRYNSFLQAIKTAWNSDKVKETKRRLDAIQSGLQFRIQILIREDQIHTKDEILHSLDEVSRNILLRLMKDRDENMKRQQARDTLAAARHYQVVDLITKRDSTQNWSPKDVVAHIKAHLQFRRQHDRFDDIVEAHKTTFQWIFRDNSTSNTPCPDLHAWLRNGQGIYWISGKAGSGKSTLMKYLFQEPILRKALDSWADRVPFLVVSFYFWNAGFDLQKSQEGLLRSILSQILDQDASFGEIMFPERFLPGAYWQDSLTFHELRRAFTRCTQSLDGRFKVIMIIDGLDEFDQISLTMTELAEMFIAATHSPNIKAILASRPLAPFEFAFKQYPKLRLHELTQNDIATYVNDKLAAHPRISGLNVDEAVGVQQLTQDVVGAAAGVFLWVRLVVRSLVEGFQNYDRISDLQKRLRAIPSDLEALFTHMLHNIPAEYRLESSQILQLVTYHYSDEQRLPLSALTLGLAQEHSAQAHVSGTFEISDAARRSIEEQVAGRLMSRCVGLLEIQLRDDRPWRVEHMNGDYAPVPCVEFLHRTVADFLKKEDIRVDISRYTQGTNFSAETSLLQAAVQRIRGSNSDLGSGILLWMSLEHAMMYARRAENSTTPGSTQLLDELDAYMTQHFISIKAPEVLDKLKHIAGGQVTDWYTCGAFYRGLRHASSHHDTFMSFVIQHGLESYVRTKLTRIGAQGILKKGRPLLHYASCTDVGNLHPDQMPRDKIVECLLQYGADPMESWGECHDTIWEQALVVSTDNLVTWLNMIKAFVSHGADLNIRVSDWRFNSAGNGRALEWSPLSYIKHRVEMATAGPSTAPSQEQTPYPRYNHDVSLPAHVVMEAKAAFEDLVRNMVAHGAKDGCWEVQYDVFDKSINSKQDMKDTLASTKIMRPRSTRNPFKWLLHRIKS